LTAGCNGSRKLVVTAVDRAAHPYDVTPDPSVWEGTDFVKGRTLVGSRTARTAIVRHTHSDPFAIAANRVACSPIATVEGRRAPAVAKPSSVGSREAMGFEARAVLVDRAARRAERHGGISERATERDHGATGPKTAERSRRTGIVTGVHGIFRSVAADERKEKEYVEQGPSHVDSLRPPKTELRGAGRHDRAQQEDGKDETHRSAVYPVGRSLHGGGSPHTRRRPTKLVHAALASRGQEPVASLGRSARANKPKEHTRSPWLPLSGHTSQAPSGRSR
jgi:hypothetical protein